MVLEFSNFFLPADVNSQDDPENSLLRGKMQRIQMMLAQRKEQRRTRREMNAPYTSPRSPHKMLASVSSHLPFSASSPSIAKASSVCMAATAAESAEKAAANHGESNSDSSSTYCKANIEQDSLAV